MVILDLFWQELGMKVPDNTLKAKELKGPGGIGPRDSFTEKGLAIL
jgi:hypothetical protein